VSEAISGSTRLAAVIGSPVRHSLSPALHNAAFRAARLDWRFVAFEVAPGAGADAVRAMRTLGIAGLAVTAPHKADVAAAVDEVDAAAAALRSVNTVILRDDGSTFGASTDGDGFVDSLRAAGFDLDGARVVVLGAGGAGRAIVDALGRAGASDIAVVNRDGARAAAAAGLARAARVGTVADVAGAELLVNATSVGMGGEATPLDPVLLHDGLCVADIVYHPLETPLLRAAAGTGARTVDGLGMLVHQAVRQQLLWTGAAPDPGVIRAAAEAELAARQTMAAR
jgi:shikimate dehydrogenase